MQLFRVIFCVLSLVLIPRVSAFNCQDELQVSTKQAADLYEEILDLEEAFEERADQIGREEAADWLLEQYPEIMLKVMKLLDEQGVSFVREGLNLVIQPSQDTLLGRIAEGLNNKLDARLLINFYENIYEDFFASTLIDELFLPFESILDVNILPFFVYHEIRHLNWEAKRSADLSPLKRDVFLAPPSGSLL
ncbi:hypothetical protein GW915_10830 [bacterium]|nr:hypothetical protein [bacterium]